MKCIITDHHDISNTTLPKALACINPKRVDNKYDFKYLAGVGVAFLHINYLRSKYFRRSL